MSSNGKSSSIRAIAFLSISALVFGVLMLRLFDLQIVHGVDFRNRSDNNRIRLIEVPAPRGIIRDHNGEILVTNTAAYSCYGVPHELWRDDGPERLDAILTPESAGLREELQPLRRSFRPVRLQRDLSFTTLSRFEEARDKIPGAFLEIEPKRYHPNGLAPHVVGYIGEISDRELELDTTRREGDLVGKRGLERLYDKQLRGVRGKRFSVVNVHGQELRPSAEFKEILPTPGNDLWLTLDRKAQMLAESLLTDKIGSIVVMDIATGAVRVMASSPAYDPNIFAGTINPEHWNLLLSDEKRPMLNRSVQTMYPPGSTVKMAVLIEGLMSGVIDENWSVSCPGYLQVGNRPFRCWKRSGHGHVDCYRSIEASCDVYFYKLGLKLGVDGIHRAYERFHLGRATGIDQTSEASGLIPSSDYYDRRYGVGKWTKGYIPSISIGQGEVLVTPLQLCAFTAALADGKYWKQPYLVERIVNPSTGIIMRPERGLREELSIPPEILEIATEGMRRVVWGDIGTARAQRNEANPLAGKTGTAQNSHGDDHAWFVGYAPIDNPRYAACALVEFGEHGSSVAAPLVRQILDFLSRENSLPAEDVASLPTLPGDE